MSGKKKKVSCDFHQQPTTTCNENNSYLDSNENILGASKKVSSTAKKIKSNYSHIHNTKKSKRQSSFNKNSLDNGGDDLGRGASNLKALENAKINAALNYYEYKSNLNETARCLSSAYKPHFYIDTPPSTQQHHHHYHKHLNTHLTQVHNHHYQKNKHFRHKQPQQQSKNASFLTFPRPKQYSPSFLSPSTAFSPFPLQHQLSPSTPILSPPDQTKHLDSKCIQKRETFKKSNSNSRDKNSSKLQKQCSHLKFRRKQGSEERSHFRFLSDASSSKSQSFSPVDMSCADNKCHISQQIPLHKFKSQSEGTAEKPHERPFKLSYVDFPPRCAGAGSIICSPEYERFE